jgi:hypothetical protein
MNNALNLYLGSYFQIDVINHLIKTILHELEALAFADASQEGHGSSYCI